MSRDAIPKSRFLFSFSRNSSPFTFLLLGAFLSIVPLVRLSPGFTSSTSAELTVNILGSVATDSSMEYFTGAADISELVSLCCVMSGGGGMAA